MPPSLANTLKASGAKLPPGKRTSPLWKGPHVDGITFSLLSRFLDCRERFRVHYVEGLQVARRFNHYIEYGQMWHTCEEALAAGRPWQTDLQDYVSGLMDKYKMDREFVDKWHNVCLVQFPVYVDYWSQHEDVINRTPILQEQVFDLQYKLPSGRIVRLRGKWDAVDLIGSPVKKKWAPEDGVFLQENKSKSELDVIGLQRQLSFDLQTMIYLVALELASKDTAIKTPAWVIGENKWPIRGVRYNVIRRPLSGGKGSIVQKKGSKNVKPETKEEYYTRLAQYIIDEPDTYFCRFKALVSNAEVKLFQDTCLDPILENVCDWYYQVTGIGTPPPAGYRTPMNWRHPFGLRNLINEGGQTDLDEYLLNGSEVGLERKETMFEELTPCPQ